MCIGGLLNIPDEYLETVTIPIDNTAIEFMYFGGSGLIIAGGDLLLVSYSLGFDSTIQKVLASISIVIGLLMRRKAMRVARDPVEAANATLTLDINTIIVLVLFSIISAYATFVVSYAYMLVSIPLILTLWLYIKVCKKEELRNIEVDPY